MAKTSWFRMENSTFFNEKFAELDAEEKLVWFFLLSYASFTNSASFRLNRKYIAMHSGVKEQKVSTAVQILADAGWVEVNTSTNADVPLRTDVTDVTDVTERDVRTATPADPVPPHPLVQIWNDGCGELPKVRDPSRERLKKVEAAWKKNPSEEFWKGIMGEVRDSHFLNGRGGGWRASFDWLIRMDTKTKVENFVKVFEGNYRNSGMARKQTFAEVREQAHKELYDKIDRGEA